MKRTAFYTRDIAYNQAQMNNYIFKSAIELSSLIRNKEANSTAIVKAHLDHIKARNPMIGAIVVLLEEQTMQVD